MKKTKKSEFDIFDETVQTLLRVPHSAIKSKLEEEKKRKKTKRSSASGHAANDRA